MSTPRHPDIIKAEIANLQKELSVVEALVLPNNIIQGHRGVLWEVPFREIPVGALFLVMSVDNITYGKEKIANYRIKASETTVWALSPNLKPGIKYLCIESHVIESLTCYLVDFKGLKEYKYLTNSSNHENTNRRRKEKVIYQKR